MKMDKGAARLMLESYAGLAVISTPPPKKEKLMPKKRLQIRLSDVWIVYGQSDMEQRKR